jgi:flagellar protein FlaF
MYRQTYAEFADDSSGASRERERAALERAVRMLAIAKVRGPRTQESFEATSYVRRLWTVFMEDLGSDGNALPATLRASLISIGLWILREVDLIDSGAASEFDSLIEINQMIADGLI